MQGNGTAINITGTGTGLSHTLSVALDGVNRKFVATHTDGTKAQMTRAAQLFLSHNGVIQRPHDTTSPANGWYRFKWICSCIRNSTWNK